MHIFHTKTLTQTVLLACGIASKKFPQYFQTNCNPNSSYLQSWADESWLKFLVSSMLEVYQGNVVCGKFNRIHSDSIFIIDYLCKHCCVGLLNSFQIHHFRMFAKPFRVKSNTQLKGSDKKKFKLEVRKKYPDFFPVPESDTGPDHIDDIITPKDDVTVSKIYTHTGESYLVYYQLKNPIFFEVCSATNYWALLI